MKKSKKANLEGKRFVFFQTGLILAVASTLVAFEWTSFDKHFETSAVLSSMEEITFESVVEVQLERPKVKVKKKVESYSDAITITDEEPVDVEEKPETDFVETDPNDFISDVDFGEGETIVIDPTLVIADVMPEFPGGVVAMNNFLKSRLKYPQIAREENVQGKVYISFIVNKNGDITDVKILKEPGYGLGKEAIRVVEKMPKWNPGINNGVPVKVKYTIPVDFRLR